MAESVGIFVSVPVAGFRAPHAREYFETLPVPPPSTVYGMLLSLVGETDRARHAGAEIALALLGRPAYSVVLRTTWRVKEKKLGPGLGANARPDFQELLTGLRLAAWVRPGQGELHGPALAERVAAVLRDPGSSQRFGALSLGESTHLVDELRLLRDDDLADAIPLNADPNGDLSLPIWPDHVGSLGTAWGNYQLGGALHRRVPTESAWISIHKA